LILSFDLKASLRRWKPERRRAPLKRRPDEALAFVSEQVPGGAELLLDTCFYIDVLQDRLPERVKGLTAARLCNHSAVALAELTHLFGRLDPRDPRSASVLKEITALITHVPQHRLDAPSVNALGEAGILAGLTARLANVEAGREQALLNDAILYLQAVENGQIVLTRNIREFDYFDQLYPCQRVLFYSTV
jgi:predicted nucleic acid-binding protein